MKDRDTERRAGEGRDMKDRGMKDRDTERRAGEGQGMEGRGAKGGPAQARQGQECARHGRPASHRCPPGTDPSGRRASAPGDGRSR
ncbi:hypothetical protein GCM10018953_68240 [Streptosporangium nondiastaticum]